MWGRFRYRRLQAVTLLALAALVTVCACLGPLFQGAMEQALTQTLLQDAADSEKAVSLNSRDVDLDSLEESLPGDVQPYVSSPVRLTAVDVAVTTPTRVSVETRLYAAEGACDHLVVVEGACPDDLGEVMVSRADAAVSGWVVGSRPRAVEQIPDLSGYTGEVPRGDVRVRVVGVYELPAGPGWLGDPFLGRAGTSNAETGAIVTDDWVTVPGTLGPEVSDWYEIESTVSWPVVEDDISPAMLLRVGRLVTEADQAYAIEDPRVGVTSQLPTLAEDLERGATQGRATVLNLMLQLLVLSLVVYWMALAAACDQRRPEVAVARLRGRGSRGAARFLLAELVPITVAGVAIGGLASLGIVVGLSRIVFPVDVPLRVPGSYLLAWIGAAVVSLFVVLGAVRRTVREPVASLLRSVPSRIAGRGPGIAEVGLVAFSLTAVVAFVSGGLEGPLGLAAPILLALAVGLLGSRALVAVAAGLGRRLMARGRFAGAVSLLNLARRPGTRRVLVLVVVSTALLVFAVDALVTGDRNRENAAEQANGAVVAWQVRTAAVDDVLDAIDELDPDGRQLTPVVTISQSGDVEHPVVAVDPDTFPDIGLFPGQDPKDLGWSTLRAPDAAPVELRGTRLRGAVTVSDVRIRSVTKELGDSTLVLVLDDADGLTTRKPLIPLQLDDSESRFDVDVPCEEGCRITGVTLETPPALGLTGDFTLGELQTETQGSVDLGSSAGWQAGREGRARVEPMEVADDSGGFRGRFVTTGSEPPVLTSPWLPVTVAALVTPVAPPAQMARGESTEVFQAPGLDGEAQDMAVAGELPRVPGSPAGARVVGLESLLRQGRPLTGNVEVEVWARGADPGLLDRVPSTLADHDVLVVSTSRLSDVRDALDETPAAWSLAIAGLVGGAALLVMAVVLVLVTVTTWRRQAADLASLRMTGVSERAVRRVAIRESLPGVVVGVVVGLGCGVVGAHYALPSVRQFTDPPDVPTTDFSTPWPSVLLAAALAMVVLGLLVWLSGRWTARRAQLARVREVV